MVGFDAELIDAWIGLRNAPAGDLETCQKGVAEPHVYYVHSAGGGAIRCVAAAPSDADRCHAG
jgi:hypothetical protein